MCDTWEPYNPPKKQKLLSKPCSLCSIRDNDIDYEDVLAWMDSTDRAVTKQNGVCEDCIAWSPTLRPVSREDFEDSLNTELVDEGNKYGNMDIARMVNEAEEAWNACDCGQRMVCMKCSSQVSHTGDTYAWQIFNHLTCPCRGCKCDGFRETFKKLDGYRFVAGRDPCPLCPMVQWNGNFPQLDGNKTADLCLDIVKSPIEIVRGLDWMKDHRRASQMSGCCRKCVAYFGNKGYMTEDKFIERQRDTHGCPYDCGVEGYDWHSCAVCEEGFGLEGDAFCLCDAIARLEKNCPVYCTQDTPCLMCQELKARGQGLTMDQYVEAYFDPVAGNVLKQVTDLTHTFRSAVRSEDCTVYKHEDKLTCCCRSFAHEKML